MTVLTLRVRSPAGLHVDENVDAILGEDASGWFGVRPGREDVIASLPPGLLSFRTARGERFVAHSGGLLDLEDGICSVLVRSASIGDELETIADALAMALQRRRESARVRRGVLDDLEREALRRVVKEADDE